MEEYELISTDVLDEVTDVLKEIALYDSEAKHAQMLIDTGRHKCDVKPNDM